MAIEDLKEQGILLPEERWGAHPPVSTVSGWGFLPAMAVAVAGLVLMGIGDGHATTWFGMGAFLAGLVAVIWVCDRAVERQRRRVRSRNRARAG